MRLHHLEVTAFGPFSATTTVDFDALSEAGVFLLSGATGAGKSSVLDAICFALYGDVPGDRAAAKRLRCDQAPADVPPVVILETTLSGRRFRIERSPSWSRPKRRGTGMTQVPARVVLSERVDAEWQPLSTRLDETGHLVTHLVGLTLSQFCQVALLPQGRFQAFLRARSDDRHQLLQQVFRTQRFDQVEKWLRERRTALRQTCTVHEQSLSDVASRISEVLGSPPPDRWGEDPHGLASWCRAGHEATAKGHAALSAQGQDLTRHMVVAETDVSEARLLAERLRRRRELISTLERLDADEPAIAAIRERLARARSAQHILPLLDRAQSARTLLSCAEADLEEAEADALRAASTASASGVDQLRSRVDLARHDLARLAPAIAAADGLGTERHRLAARLVHIHQREETIDSRIEQVPGELDAARVRLATTEREAARAERLELELTHLVEQAAAHARLEELYPEQALGSTAVSDARDALTSAKESWLDIRERRLGAMASELAAGLAVGDSCPVCGSPEHPSPAATTGGEADAAAERTARRFVDDLEVTLEAHRSHLRDLDSEIAGLRAVASGPADEVATRRVQVQHDLAAIADLAAAGDGLRHTIADLESEVTHLGAEQAALGVERVEAQARLVHVERVLEELDHAAGALLEEWEVTRVDDLPARLDELEARCVRAQGARDAVAAARVALDEVSGLAIEAIAAASFDDESDARSALLAPDQVAGLAQGVADFDAARQEARQGLADPALHDLDDSAPPPLAMLEARLAEVRVAREDVAARTARQAVVLDRVRRLEADLEGALAAYEPLRDERDLVEQVCSFVEGRSPDNRLSMRLSAYVLAHRLTQVVEAANARLAPMTGQRYSLVHTGRRGAGETRGGLSLLVLDEWSGESRDPATLSGGETFVVSLALALGLADVIAGEAGGADLQTLFVDEGFGALDADTLDDVMDTLDTLRDGGRVVGVVSHVPEMQTRIPSQLRLHKGRAGSRATMHLG